MKNIFDVSGKKALVTGGGNGIGLGLAKGLLEAGASVVLSSKSDSAVLEAEKFRENGFDAYAVTGDLALDGGAEQIFREAFEKLGGRLDILVNSAGTQYRGDAISFPLEEFDRVMNVNHRSMFILCKLALKDMVERGYGKIVNIASMQSFSGIPNNPAYAASKGAVAQLTKAIGNEWISKGINVNAIAPGWFATNLTKGVVEDPVRTKEIQLRLPAGRWGKPEDLVGALIFLCSEASDYMSGVILPVDGGYLSR